MRARVEAGDDPAAVIADAIEIGARVLHREQTGANVEFVKAELEKTAREVQGEFAERSRAVAEVFDRKFDEAFGPETGHVARVLTKHFGDESSVAVQNQLKAALAEAMGVMRDDLRKQFTADSDDNPFAVFQRAWLGAMKQTSDQQHARLREMSEQMQGLVVELERARAEKEKAEAVAQEAERGTAKGRSFEEAVYAALDEIAVRAGRRLRRGGRRQGRHRQDRRRRGGDRGLHRAGARPRRVRGEGLAAVEAEGGRGARPRARRAQADFAVLVVPDEERIPAKMHQLREYGGDKLIACFDPEEGSTLSLEVAYSLARARVLMARGEADGIDASAIREAIERATGAMSDVLRVKQQLTGAQTSIEKGADILDALATAVRAQLTQVELLLAAAGEDPPEPPDEPPPAAAAAIPAAADDDAPAADVASEAADEAAEPPTRPLRPAKRRRPSPRPSRRRPPRPPARQGPCRRPSRAPSSFRSRRGLAAAAAPGVADLDRRAGPEHRSAVDPPRERDQRERRHRR